MTSENKDVQVLKAHLAINVHNVERSIEFYKKLLGLEPTKVRTGYAKFDVKNPPLNLTLNEHQFNDRRALSHLGIQVKTTDDVLTIRERGRTRDLSRATRCRPVVATHYRIKPGCEILTETSGRCLWCWKTI